MITADLLISNYGFLRIADFGLARCFDPNLTSKYKGGHKPERKYTNYVVTVVPSSGAPSRCTIL